MVHALRGLWRVLTPGGSLVDLRPRSSHCPVEAVLPDRFVQIGDVDATGMAAEDAAADRAIGDAVNEGWFVPRRQATFDFDWYWDTVSEMASFMESSKRIKQLRPPSADLETVHRSLAARERGRVRLRCRRPTLLAVYDKAVDRMGC